MNLFNGIFNQAEKIQCGLTGTAHALLSLCAACMIFFCSGCGDEFGILLEAESSHGLHRGIYWAEENKTIGCAEKNGTGKKTLYTVTGTPLDIDVYSSGGKIYWTEYTGSLFQIWSGNVKSGSKSLYYQPTAVEFGPSVIAVDPETGSVYWNEYHTHNDVWRSPAYAPEKWIKTITPFYTFDISIDVINDKIYATANTYWNIYYGSSLEFGTGLTGVICDSNLNDGSPSLPVTVNGPSDPSVPIRGIAADGRGGYVYFVINDSAEARIVRAPRTNLPAYSDFILPGTYGFSIRKIALDTEERKIYWTSSPDQAIWRADLDTGLNIEQILVLDSIPTGIAIVP